MQYTEIIKRLDEKKIISVYKINKVGDCLVAAKGVNKTTLKKIAERKY